MRRALLAIMLVSAAATAGCKRKELEAELANTRKQLTDTESELAAQKQTNQELSAQNQSYEAKIAELEQELAGLNAQLEEFAEQQGITAMELAELRAEKAKRERELQVYKDLFGQLKKLVDAGTIEVVFRKGRMTLNLRNEILFDSGKSRLRPEGVSAVTEIVPALLSVGDREFLVAGHTDNVPINSARFKSNWELSTARAVSMVKAMVDAGYPPERLGAGGFGEYDPVASNDAPNSRAQNRRIEIILMPKLGEIPGMKEMLSGRKNRS